MIVRTVELLGVGVREDGELAGRLLELPRSKPRLVAALG
jgi:hypothetical protein